MLNNTTDKIENAPQEIGEKFGGSATDVASHETFQEFWDLFGREDGAISDLYEFVQYLNRTQPGHGLGLLEMMAAMNAAPDADFIYGFGFSELPSRDRVRRRLELLKNPKLRPEWDEEYSDTCELAEILREPECALALSKEEMFRLIEERLQGTTRTIDALGRRPVNYNEIMDAMRSDLEGLAHNALEAA